MEDARSPDGLNLQEAVPGSKNYARLFRRFVLLTMVCSLLPLLLTGWGLHLYYARFSRERTVAALKNEVGHHRKIIELFLQERCAKLQLIAATQSKGYLTTPANLKVVFELINRDHWTISDMGVIDADGRHLAYIGPYDLMDKNYADTFWFKAVMDKGVYISDMFMGFRREPHFVIAVASAPGPGRWILRATIDTEAFRSLVENVRIGNTGEVYLVNGQGILQTSPRFSGRIMDRTADPIQAPHAGIRIRVIEPRREKNGEAIPRRIVSQVWLDHPRWLLVVRQDFDEAFKAVGLASKAALIFLHISALTILVVAIFITRHMISVIRSRDHAADDLNRQLMQASKLASIGQLSAGVAHEINNPLAIVMTERQLLLDAHHRHSVADSDFSAQFEDSMAQIGLQIQRCKRITHNLLRFSRRTRSVIEEVDLNGFVQEVVELMEREARANGINFHVRLDAQLPVILSDPSQLQQVFLNLITNAVDAHEEKPYGSVSLETAVAPDHEGVILSISDTGCGIAPQHLDKIFDPFFTTKPVGKGTGLGLSICYSIIGRLGGEIRVKSTLGEGTTFDIFLPPNPPVALLKEMGGAH
ncbi:MAG: two-component sensor histidine kinase [Desulfobacterales bacterium]|nr:two-component sensor histidine kinase [Desulfobacterales bacterium]